MENAPCRSRWERLLESGWARRTKVREERQAQGSEKEAWQSRSVTVKNPKQMGRVTRDERG